MQGRKGNRFGPWAALLLVLPLLGGCASTANGGGGGAAGGSAVVVDNNLIPPTALTVYLVPEAGVRRLLGNVSPSQTRTLTIGTAPPGQHQLMARTTSGREIESNVVSFGAADTLRWDLTSNIVTVRDDD